MGGYAIGLGVLGVGVLGMWLLGPKSKSTTSPPAGIPSLNQALRGTAVPVTFGTNRVSSQIVWTNNFKAVRQKSSGKGGAKGGGSGGFGSAKGGGSAGLNYEYFWDMIFNFGIVDQPSIMRRGWVGGDNLDNATVSAITAGASESVLETFPVDSVISDQQTATMNFQEAFFAPGYTTPDDLLEPWPFFESITNTARAFPTMSYIGFRQLDLGQSPSVPQLDVELVPINDSTFNVDPKFLNSKSAPYYPMSGNGQQPMYDEKGGSYSFLRYDTGDVQFSIFNINTGDTRDYLIDELRADVFAAVGISPSFNGCFAIAGTPYFYVMMTQGGPPVSFLHTFMRYKITTDGIVVDGFYSLRTSSNDTWGDTLTVATCGGNGNAFLLMAGDNHTGIPFVMKLPLTGSLQDWTEGSIYAYYNVMTNWGSDAFPNNPSGRFVNIRGTVAVDADDNIYVLQYVCDEDYQNWTVDGNTTNDRILAMSGPGTWFGRYDEVPTLVDFDIPAKTHLDGSASDNIFDDWISPSFFSVQGQGYLAFSRPFIQSADLHPIGSKIRVKIFRADFASGTFDVFNDSTASYFDPVADTGVAEGNRFNAPPRVGQLGYNPISGELILDTDFDYIGGLLFDTRVYSEWGLFGGPDVTPAYIIYRILTNEYFGFATSSLFGFTTSTDRIDTASYIAADAYCQAQGIKLSVTYTDANDLLATINDLLALYGGFLTDNDGMIQFGIVTADDLPIRTIDNHHLVPDDIGKPPVQVTKAALEDGYNKIQFNYLDRTLDYKQSQVEAADEVDMDFNGPRVKTFQAQYTMAGSTAQMIATRALWQNLYGNDQYSFKLGWKDADLKPGSLITLVDSFDATLSGGVLARILKWQESDRGKFTVTAVQQRPYIIAASASYTATSSIAGGFGSLIQPAQPPLHQTAYELPLEFQGAKALMYFGYAPAAANMGAQLYLSTDGENYVLTQDTQPFIISGALARPLEARHQNYVEDQVEFFIFPTSGMLASSPTFVQTYELDDVSPALRAQGAGTFIIGSEAVAVEGLTLLSQNHYKAKRMFRGWGGTPITHHNSGEWFHQQAAGIFNHEISVDDIGNVLSYKIVPYNFIGKGFDISSIDAQTYTILGDYWLPRVMSRLHVFVDSPLSGLPTTARHDHVSVFGHNSPVTLKWSDSSNHDGFGAAGFGSNLYGHFAPDDPEPSYLVKVNSTNGTTVSSFVVTTGYFNYTVAQNSADWNGFQQNLNFTVQPFNVKGIGPTSATRSLMMF